MSNFNFDFDFDYIFQTINQTIRDKMIIGSQFVGKDGRTISQLCDNVLMNGETIPFFIVMSSVYWLSYPLLSAFLYCTSFVHGYNGYPSVRRYYIISNLLKSVMLAFISYIFVGGILSGPIALIYTETWGNGSQFYINMTALYAITDVIALLMNWDGMQTNTRFHHICVFLSYVYVCFSDFAE